MTESVGPSRLSLLGRPLRVVRKEVNKETKMRLIQWGAATLGAAALLCAGAASAAPKTFTVNGETVTAAEQQKLIDMAVKDGAKATPELEAKIKDLLIQEKVLGKAARDGKFHKKKEVVDAVKRTETKLAVEAMMVDWVKKNPVTEADVKKAYENMKKAYGDTEYDVSRIVVKDEKTAEKLIERINKGEKFEKLAKENTIIKAEKEKSGKLGWISTMNLDRRFSSSFVVLKPGSIAQAAIPVPQGFAVVKLNGKRAQKNFPSYEKEKESLKNQLERRRAFLHFSDMVSKAKIREKK